MNKVKAIHAYWSKRGDCAFVMVMSRRLVVIVSVVRGNSEKIYRNPRPRLP